MALIRLGLTTILARSGREAGRMMVEGNYDGVLLDFPGDFQFVVDLLRGGERFEAALDVVKDLFGDFYKSWLYKNGPILESVRLLPRADVEVICMGDMEQEKKILKDRMSISLLEYRAMATGRVDVLEWRRLLKAASQNMGMVVKRQGERILESVKGGRWLCITGVPARGLEYTLRSHGHHCEVMLLGKPYLGIPIEALSAELSEGDPTDDRVEYLALCQLNFVRDYVMTSNDIDEAYDRWLENDEWAKLYHQSDG